MIKVAGGTIINGKMHIWHNWFVQELTLNLPLFKNPDMPYPEDWLGEVHAELLPGPYISMN